MDAAALARLAIEILTPVTSTTAPAVTFANINDASYRQGKLLYDALHKRFAQEDDSGKANKLLQRFIEDPYEYSEVVGKKIFVLLQTDPAFTDTLHQIIQKGPRQELSSAGEAKASSTRMRNSLGWGRQEMKVAKRSTVENVRMNII